MKLWRVFFVFYGQGYLALSYILRNIICVKVTTCNFPWKKCSLKLSSVRDFFHLIQKCICAKVFVSLDELQWKMCKTIAETAVPATAAQAPTHKMTAGKSEWLKNNRMFRLNVVEGKSTTVSGEINLNVGLVYVCVIMCVCGWVGGCTRVSVWVCKMWAKLEAWFSNWTCNNTHSKLLFKLHPIWSEEKPVGIILQEVLIMYAWFCKRHQNIIKTHKHKASIQSGDEQKRRPRSTISSNETKIMSGSRKSPEQTRQRNTYSQEPIWATMSKTQVLWLCFVIFETLSQFIISICFRYHFCFAVLCNKSQST